MNRRRNARFSPSSTCVKQRSLRSLPEFGRYPLERRPADPVVPNIRSPRAVGATAWGWELRGGGLSGMWQGDAAAWTADAPGSPCRRGGENRANLAPVSTRRGGHARPPRYLAQPAPASASSTPRPFPTCNSLGRTRRGWDGTSTGPGGGEEARQTVGMMF